MSNIISPSIVKEVYKKRLRSAKKYDHGLVIVIGGSKIYTGSPTLSALAALRAGADIAQVVAPQRVADISAGYSPDIITFPLEGNFISPAHLAEILTVIKIGEDVSHGNIAVVIGGGLGRDEETKKAIRSLVERTSAPMVVDADAIYAFEKEKRTSFVSNIADKNIIFTPHLYEFFILSGKNIKNLHQEERLTEVKKTATEINSTILVKGKIDYVSDGVEAKKNIINVPYMTVGGTGDVLAGITGSLLARKCSPFTAACGAVVVNTLAGEMAANITGEGMIATDVLNEIPKVIKNQTEN